MRRGVCVVAASLWSASILSMAAQAATPLSPRAPQQQPGAVPPTYETRFRVTFMSPGVYTYICALHDDLGMKGTVEVVP